MILCTLLMAACGGKKAQGESVVSGLKSRQITARDGSHVLVENNYENYEYDVLLTLVKDGDTFKIDSLKQEKSEYK